MRYRYIFMSLSLVLGGCGSGPSLYPAKYLKVNTEIGEHGGRMLSLYMHRYNSNYKILHDERDAYIYVSDDTINYLYGITNPIQLRPCYSDCLRTQFRNGYKEISLEKRGGRDSNIRFGGFSTLQNTVDIAVEQKIEQDDGPDMKVVAVEFIDRSGIISKINTDYQNAISAGTIEALEGFLNNYPAQIQKFKSYTDVKYRIFKETYDVSVINSNNSAQRAITESGLLSSMAGSCQDISRRIRISPKQGAKFYPMVIKVDYTLNRTYKPYALSEENDPIVQSATHRLNATNNYTMTYDVTYPCVLTSGRVHSAGLSLLGALAGMKKEDTGVSTTLEKTSFTFDITEVE